MIGNPGVELLFDNAVYVRGAMTLQMLRGRVGDDDFFEILRSWAASKSGGNATTDEFIALAEQISGEQLDDLFETWLFTAGKPDFPAASTARVTRRGTQRAGGWLGGFEQRLANGHY